MIQSRTEPDEPAPCDAQAISRWARVYAQNRSLGVVVFLMIFVLLAVAIGGTSFLAGVAFRKGNMLLFGVSMAVLSAALAAVVYLSVPRWGGKLQERIVGRLYAKEGSVALAAPAPHAKAWALALVVFLGASIIASVVAGFVYEIPSKYMQPISALYIVPFLVGLWLLMRPVAGYPALLWPLLYAAHAILILAGAPILFTGPWDGLNMLVPVAGYGAFSGLVGHLYSRVALGRLRKLTRTDATGDQPEEVSQS